MTLSLRYKATISPPQGDREKCVIATISKVKHYKEGTLINIIRFLPE